MSRDPRSEPPSVPLAKIALGRMLGVPVRLDMSEADYMQLRATAERQAMSIDDFVRELVCISVNGRAHEARPSSVSTRLTLTLCEVDAALLTATSVHLQCSTQDAIVEALRFMFANLPREGEASEVG